MDFFLTEKYNNWCRKKNNNNNNKKKISMAWKPLKSTKEEIGQLDLGQWKIPILDNTEYGETLRVVRLL